MKKYLVISFSKVLLNFILFMLGMIIVVFVVFILCVRIDINVCVYFILNIIYFLVVYDLCKIVYSINVILFLLDNVSRFKRIGYYMIVMVVIDGILKWKIKSDFDFMGI